MPHAVEWKVGADLVVGDILANFTRVVDDGTNPPFVQVAQISAIADDPTTAGALAVTIQVLWGTDVMNEPTETIRRFDVIPLLTGDLTECLP